MPNILFLRLKNNTRRTASNMRYNMEMAATMDVVNVDSPAGLVAKVELPALRDALTLTVLGVPPM